MIAQKIILSEIFFKTTRHSFTEPSRRPRESDANMFQTGVCPAVSHVINQHNEA